MRGTALGTLASVAANALAGSVALSDRAARGPEILVWVRRPPHSDRSRAADSALRSRSQRVVRAAAAETFRGVQRTLARKASMSRLSSGASARTALDTATSGGL